jgi:hypothetical protein
LASGITAADTANWNSSGSGGGGPETDPIFLQSPAGGITTTDIINWNVFLQSPASGITTADINNWNDTSSTVGGGPETDPIFSSSVAGAITASDTTYRGNKVHFSELVLSGI